jgi:putative ABC transport system substrate-binding protein
MRVESRWSDKSSNSLCAATAGPSVRIDSVANLARPGGNVTGSTGIAPDLSGKRLELLREVISKSAPVAVLFYPNPGSWDQIRETETAARGLGVRLQPVEVRDPNEFENAYVAMSKQRASAVIIILTSFTNNHRKQLVTLALKNRLPSVCEQSEWTTDGCLISYGPNVLFLFRRAAIYVDKILKGAKPGDLPVEQPTKFEFVINLKTAKQIGLTIPPKVLARATKLIK